MICIRMTDGCGEPRTQRGIAPIGWIKVRRARTDSEDRWYCSVECVMRLLNVVRHGQASPVEIHHTEIRNEPKIVEVPVKVEVPVVEYVYRELISTDDVPPRNVSQELTFLNLLAGTHLNIMNATPERVSFALARAFERTVKSVGEAAEYEKKRRPTTQELLDEAALPVVEDEEPEQDNADAEAPALSVVPVETLDVVAYL